MREVREELGAVPDCRVLGSRRLSERYTLFTAKVSPVTAFGFRPVLSEHDAWGWFGRDQALGLKLRKTLRPLLRE